MHRREKMASSLQKILGTLIAEGLGDPRLDGAMVSLTQVKVDPDGRAVRISFSVLPAERQTLVTHAIQEAATHLRRLAGDRLRVRRIPELRFVLDDSLKRQAEIFSAIAEVTDEETLVDEAGDHQVDEATSGDQGPIESKSE